MMLVRPGRPDDVEALVALAQKAGVGLTTLPASQKVLTRHLADSGRAFSREIDRPRGEKYLLVMENALTGDLAGCASLVGRVGGFDPFFSYELQKVRKTCEPLGVDKEVETLNLVQDHKGPSEIGTLFVDPDFRRGGHGRLMSLSRFLFIAACPNRFTDEVIAEMRGNVDPVSGSPFWDAIGRHFFEMPFVDADERSAAQKQFIADLMPQHPIYVSMLPAEAQRAIGQVHPEAEPALRLLIQEGFKFGDEVDIFDAGPLYRVETTSIRSIRESRTGRLSRATPEEPDGPLMLLSNNSLDFRAVLGRATLDEDGGVCVSTRAALALGLRLNDELRIVEARAAEKGVASKT